MGSVRSAAQVVGQQRSLRRGSRSVHTRREERGQAGRSLGFSPRPLGHRPVSATASTELRRPLGRASCGVSDADAEPEKLSAPRHPDRLGRSRRRGGCTGRRRIFVLNKQGTASASEPVSPSVAVPTAGLTSTPSYTTTTTPPPTTTSALPLPTGDAALGSTASSPTSTPDWPNNHAIPSVGRATQRRPRSSTKLRCRAWTRRGSP
ncbi:Uncharacterised protein [Mycolicibacterium fortuitum]|uniref:Uncharacterized protein n=1 Tax=Mycolicibacterium fortuitum TaxID=1766 RepID=A0A378UYN5_MYCFO|nr:Uncharacterised protein [Mycolicibacterium fortuitum]